MNNSEAAALHEEGLQRSKKGDLRGALLCHEKALPGLTDPEDELVCRGAIGILQVRLGYAESGLGHLRLALELAEKTSSLIGQVLILGDLGSAYHLTQQLPEALDYYRRGLDLARKIPDREKEGMFLANMGLIHVSQGQFRPARLRLNEALAISRKLGNVRSEGMCLGALGTACLGEGDAAAALTHYEMSQQLAERLMDPQMMAAAANGLSQAHHALGNVEKATHFAAKLQDIARRMGYQ